MTRALAIEVCDDEVGVAKRGAELIANAAREAIDARRRFVFAVSGGHTPWLMLRELAKADLHWAHVHIVQVDERVAPAGDPARNFTHISESLLDRVAIPVAHVHAMPVNAPNLDAAAMLYAQQLRDVAGTPAVLDLVHLGLGPDGHTASLTPGDPVCAIADADVAPTAPYQGHRRMTLTFPTLDRARQVLFVVTGAEKIDALKKLRARDMSIPASHLSQDHAIVIADSAAAGP